MSAIVLDASALIKLYIDEDGSAAAEAALQTADLLLAPDLILPEAANVLWKYVSRSQLSTTDAEQLLGDILQMPIRLTASYELIEPALKIAIDTQRTVYDCLCIALAVQASALLITADERLVNALSTTPYSAHIRHTASFD